MFAQLLQQGKGLKGEPLLSPSTTEQGKMTETSSLLTPSAHQTLNQNSVTTHELSDESTSSLGE
jgi:hypothetical protein